MATVKKEFTADVERVGTKITIPEGSDIPDVIRALQRAHDADEQMIRRNASVDCPPWDGALAMQRAIKEVLGIVIQQKDWTGSAGEVSVEVAYGESQTVKWGQFALPGMGDAQAYTGTDYDATEQTMRFSCVIACKRKYQAKADEILALVRKYAATDSLHKGKAFSIRFRDEDGDNIELPTPKFFQMEGDDPIFRRDLEAAIERNVFIPIRKTAEVQAMGESLKRGVLFAGKYGVGKTMLATHIAREAVKNGWTFVYVKDSAELPQALKYAQRYQPVVVFAEDVDRVAGGTERTDAVNSLLNQLDGLDSKAAQIMTVLTSNHTEKLSPAMRRPGRIDVILHVLPPDGEAIERMVYAFGKGGVEVGTDLTEIKAVLSGNAPAFVREAVGRARYEALRRTGSAGAMVNGDDLAAVAREIRGEQEMFAPPVEPDNHAETLGKAFSMAGMTLQRSTNGSARIPARPH